MSEHEELWPMFSAIIKAVESDWTGHLPDCGYTDERQECGCAEFGGKVHAALKPFAARLADAEARAEAAEAKVARVKALADRAEANRASHFGLDDCGCSMKDCYECGYWCRCTHTPWAAIREALRGDQ